MRLRLRNQKNPKKTLSMSSTAWYSILDLAEEYGWNPMGTVLLDWCLDSEPEQAGYGLDDLDYWLDRFTASEGRLVMLEDALNLADALERAFLEHEPVRPQEVSGFTRSGMGAPASRLRSGIGAVSAVIEFCRLGAFLIE